MKLFSMFFIFTSLVLGSEFYEIKEKSSKGMDIDFSKYKNKVILVTNIATRCGYTPQLDDLEKLHQKFKNNDFVMLAVPSNDFGGQTPETSEKAAEFCRLNYGVTFPILKKQVVSGEERSNLFKYFQKQIGTDFNVKWNFEKFIVGKDGKLKGSFRSSVNPMSEEITKLITKELQ